MSVSKIICMKDEDFRTMATQGYVVVDGVQINYSGSNLYFTDYMSADMVDDSNSAKKFLTTTQVTQLAYLSTAVEHADAAYNAVQTFNSALDGKQATLVSGTNIKTINGNSILGSGNISVVASLIGSQTTGQNIKQINGTTITGSGNLDIDSFTVVDNLSGNNAPDTDNTTGRYKVVVSTTRIAKADRKNGYIYLTVKTTSV